MPDEPIEGGSGEDIAHVAEVDAGAADAAQNAGKTDAEWKRELALRDKRIDDLNSHMQSRTDKLMARFDAMLERMEKNPPKTEAAAEAQSEKLRDYRKEIQEKYDKGELSGEEFLGLIEQTFVQAETRAVSKAEARAKEIEARVAAAEARMADLDPAYVSNREKVAEVQAEFEKKHGVKLDRKTAMAIVAEMKPRQPARPPIPGGVGAGVGRASSDDGDGDMSQDERAALESIPGIGKLSDKELAALRKARR